MTTDFLSELGIIVHVDHPNVAKVISYGVEGGMHLVLELSPHGSLSSNLYGLFYNHEKAFQHQKSSYNSPNLNSQFISSSYMFIQAQGKNWLRTSGITLLWGLLKGFYIFMKDAKGELSTKILKLLIYCFHRILNLRYTLYNDWILVFSKDGVTDS